MNQQLPQTQIMFCGYSTRQDAMNYMVAPGYILLFMDPDMTHVYKKALPYGSYQADFQEYELIRPAQTVQEPECVSANISFEKTYDQIMERISRMEDSFEGLKKSINNKPYYNKKEGNK